MPKIMEQIGKMTRAEQVRLAHFILDAIEHGTVIGSPLHKGSSIESAHSPTQPKNDFSCFFGKTHLVGDPVTTQRAMRDEW